MPVGWFLRVALIAMALCTDGPPSALAQSSPPSPVLHFQGRDDLRLTRLSPIVWMHTTIKILPNFGPFPSNGLLVIDGPDAILVDSAWNDEQTAAILDWAAQELKHPVTRAVFTHAHEDKMGGVGAIIARDIATYALPLTNELSADRGLVAARNDLALAEAGPPVFLGPVELFYPGPGHTADNIVANVGTAGILFGGCLIRPARARTLGNILDASVGHWQQAVEAVATRFPGSTIVVPSHGPPAGRELLDLTADLAQAGR